jgi:predicted nucleic acid-binding Zn ribbon protein
MNALCSEKAREIVFQKRSMNRARMKPVSFFNPNIATILRWVRLGWIFF